MIKLFTYLSLLSLFVLLGCKKSDDPKPIDGVYVRIQNPMSDHRLVNLSIKDGDKTYSLEAVNMKSYGEYVKIDVPFSSEDMILTAYMGGIDNETFSSKDYPQMKPLKYGKYTFVLDFDPIFRWTSRIEIKTDEEGETY